MCFSPNYDSERDEEEGILHTIHTQLSKYSIAIINMPKSGCSPLHIAMSRGRKIADITHIASESPAPIIGELFRDDEACLPESVTSLFTHGLLIILTHSRSSHELEKMR